MYILPKYGWIGADMQCFGHFRLEVPEIAIAVRIQRFGTSGEGTGDESG
jgi:hypothetical protein